MLRLNRSGAGQPFGWQSIMQPAGKLNQRFLEF
jgi:hypothetical protein